MEKLFLSVIIPTLNEEQYITKLLNDLVKQKNKNFEVIVVDGNSHDKTKKTVEQFADKLNLTCKVVDKRNVSFQRNYGAEVAKGNYLVFLDADTRINPQFIKKTLHYIEKDEGLIFIPKLSPDNNSPQIKIFFQFINYMAEISQNTGKPFSLGGSMIWEKNFFTRIGGFDEKLFMSEDHNLIQKAHRWRVRPKFLNNVYIVVSLRRMKKEGELQSLKKYIKVILHMFIIGDVREKIFDYEMGGHLYTDQKQKHLLHAQQIDPIEKIKKIFNKMMQE